MNIVILEGRLVSAPELRTTTNNKSVVNITVACTDPYHKDKADFIRCTAYGKTAETIAKYLNKGDPINVTGRWVTGSYVDSKTNSTVYTNTCVIYNFEFPLQKPKTQAQKAIEDNIPYSMHPSTPTWGEYR